MRKLILLTIPAMIAAFVIVSAPYPAMAGEEFQLAQLPMQQTDDPHVQMMIDASAADAPLTWDVPDGWQEAKGKGMRMATFTPASGGSLECSVISLKGMAGGIEGNIERWMAQIDLSMPPMAFQSFMDNLETITTGDGNKAHYVDLAQFQQSQSEEATSIIAAILQLPTQTVFFKMTGPLGEVKKNDARLRALIASVTVNQAAQ